LKHWFVDWLEEEAESKLKRAKEYREALKGDTPESKTLLEAFEDRSELVEWADRHEEAAARLKSWVSLAADMISCGLEKGALAYYDARQAIEPWLLPPRLKFELTRTITGILEYLEQRINMSSDQEEKEALREVDSTISELFSVGMDEVAITYYLRKRRKNPELDLPESDAYLD